MPNEENSFFIIPINFWDEFKKLAFKDALITNVIELEEKHGKFITLTDEQKKEILEK